MVSTRSRSKRKKKDEEGNIDDGAQDAADTISSAAKAASSSKALTPKKSPIKGIVTRLKTKKIRQQSPKEQREDDQDDDTRLDNETRVVPSDNDESMEAVLSTKTGNDNGDVESEEEGVTDVEDDGVARSFKSDDIRLIYPYDIDAAEGLEQLSNDLFDGIEFIELSTKTSNPSSSNGALRGIITLQQRDLEKLEPRTYLNDSNIDFFMKWLTRNLPADSDIAIMSSFFYTELDRLGEKAVSQWSRNIDIFSKDIVIVPVTGGLHHSFCAIIHPGSIVYAHNKPKFDYPRSLFLFMDSSRGSHDPARICQNLRGWLNHLWREESKIKAQPVSSPFGSRKMPVVIPTVPQQPNGTCCGVYVCRNACGLLMLYKRCNGSISTRDTDCALLVSESPEFNYGQSEVEQLRLDMKILVERLSAKYLSWQSLQPVNEDGDGSDLEVWSAAPSSPRTPSKVIEGTSFGDTITGGDDSFEVICGSPVKKKVVSIVNHGRLQHPDRVRFAVEMQGASKQEWITADELRDLDEEMLVEYLAENKALRKRSEFSWVQKTEQFNLIASKSRKRKRRVQFEGMVKRAPSTPRQREIGIGGFPKATPGRSQKSVFTGQQLGKVVGLKSSPFDSRKATGIKGTPKRYRQHDKEYAKRKSHMKGRGAERKRTSWYKKLFDFLHSVTPAPVDHEGKSTAHWERVYAFNIVVDPYLDSNKNGGRRPDYCLGSTTKVVMTARDEEERSKLISIMRTAVRTDFEGDDEFEFIFVHDVTSAEEASKGKYRSKVKVGPKRKTEEGHAISALFEECEAVCLDDLIG